MGHLLVHADRACIEFSLVSLTQLACTHRWTLPRPGADTTCLQRRGCNHLQCADFLGRCRGADARPHYAAATLHIRLPSPCYAGSPQTQCRCLLVNGRRPSGGRVFTSSSGVYQSPAHLARVVDRVSFSSFRHLVNHLMRSILCQIQLQPGPCSPVFP